MPHPNQGSLSEEELQAVEDKLAELEDGDPAS
mgnify:CR=1 FL=1